MSLSVLSVASECAPLIKTGGLADVVGSLPGALVAHGVSMRMLLPGYPAVKAAMRKAGAQSVVLPETLPPMGGTARLLVARYGALDLIALDLPAFFERPGNPYLGPDGQDWPDNAQRFAALSAVGAWIAQHGVEGWTPDAVHVHDWQAGLVPAYLHQAGAHIPTVATIHNIAFQGLFDANLLAPLGIDARLFHSEGLEYYGRIGFLKAALVYADRITTVSPTYAREVMTPDYGMGLEGVLQRRAVDVSGILNGVDTDVWDPAHDPLIAKPYSARALKGKAANRAALTARFRLTEVDGPLICVISRMTRQKGLDVLLETLPALIDSGAALAVLGAGDRDLETGFIAAARRYPGQIGVMIGYDETLSHQIQAGGDAILVPSRFEPCGLTQLYGLRYGTLPLVARTGGLADTVVDANEAALIAGVATGFVFAPVSPTALGDTLCRVVRLYADRPTWTAMIRHAMRHPVGWDLSAARYAALFRGLTSSAVHAA